MMKLESFTPKNGPTLMPGSFMLFLGRAMVFYAVEILISESMGSDYAFISYKPSYKS